MNGILFRTFISCLKDWRTCSWWRFCFPETGHLVYGRVESFILSSLLYFMYIHLLPHLMALTWPMSLKAKPPPSQYPHISQTSTLLRSLLSLRDDDQKRFIVVDQVINWVTDNKHAVNPLYLQSKMPQINLPVPTSSQFQTKGGLGVNSSQPRGQRTTSFQSPASPRVSRITSIVLGFSGFCFYFTHPYPTMNFRQMLTKPIRLNQPVKCKSLGTDLAMSQK